MALDIPGHILILLTPEVAVAELDHQAPAVVEQVEPTEQVAVALV